MTQKQMKERLITLCQSVFETKGLADIVSEEISDICCEIFITEEGCVNCDNVAEFKSYGYNIYPTERDSFGWLLGAFDIDDVHTVYWG